MADCVRLSYLVDGDNFVSAGSATESVKSALKGMGVNPSDVRRVAISMYEGEINMVIHANGGHAYADIYVDKCVITLIDTGKGIPDIELAMKPGYSTASEEVRSLGFGAGMGLPNIKTYSDRLKIDTEIGVGTTLTIEIDFD